MRVLTFPNWFGHYANRYFGQHLAPMAGRPGLRFLQIGAFTGDATIWMLDNILTGNYSRLVDVDTWEGSDEPEHEPFNFTDVETVYDQRTSPYIKTGRLTKYKGTSLDYLQEAAAGFDFIYIDGSHTAADVLTDAVLAYPLLKLGGLLAFDDYLWQSGKGRLHDPGPAIDVIADLYSDRLTKLVRDDLSDLQVWFRRTA